MTERLTEKQLYAMTVNLTPFKGRVPTSERLTDEQLRNMSAWLPHHSEQRMASELLALRARVAQLEAALQSIKSYAEAHDDEWIPFTVDEALKDAPQ